MEGNVYVIEAQSPRNWHDLLRLGSSSLFVFFRVITAKLPHLLSFCFIMIWNIISLCRQTPCSMPLHPNYTHTHTTLYSNSSTVSIEMTRSTYIMDCYILILLERKLFVLTTTSWSRSKIKRGLELENRSTRQCFNIRVEAAEAIDLKKYIRVFHLCFDSASASIK